MTLPASSRTTAIEFANSLDQEGMTAWLRRRLTGADERFPLDRRIDELPHQLIGSLFKDARLLQEAREKLKLATIFLLREAREAPSDSAWKHDAVEDLFLLLSEVFPPLGPQPQGDTLRSEAGQLLAGWSRELPVRGEGSTSPRLGCLRALRDLGWLETVEFWKSQWDPQYPETALPVLQGLVSFPGMEEEAFDWMAGLDAAHWNEVNRLLKTLKPVWMKNPRIQAHWDEWMRRTFDANIQSDVLSVPAKVQIETKVLGEVLAGSTGGLRFSAMEVLPGRGEALVTVERKKEMTVLARVGVKNQLQIINPQSLRPSAGSAALTELIRAVLIGMGCPSELVEQTIGAITCDQESLEAFR